MIKKNLEIDIKEKCIEEYNIQTQLKKEGLLDSFVRRSIKIAEGIVNKIFVSMVDDLE